MSQRSIFGKESKKRLNARNTDLSVSLRIEFTTYFADIDRKLDSDYRTEAIDMGAYNQQELEKVIRLIYKVKTSYATIPVSSRGMKVKITGSVGSTKIDIEANNLMDMQKAVNEIKFEEPAYEPWALKLRKL